MTFPNVLFGFLNLMVLYLCNFCYGSNDFNADAESKVGRETRSNSELPDLTSISDKAIEHNSYSYHNSPYFSAFLQDFTEKLAVGETAAANRNMSDLSDKSGTDLGEQKPEFTPFQEFFYLNKINTAAPRAITFNEAGTTNSSPLSATVTNSSNSSKSSSAVKKIASSSPHSNIPSPINTPNLSQLNLYAVRPCGPYNVLSPSKDSDRKRPTASASPDLNAHSFDTYKSSSENISSCNNRPKFTTSSIDSSKGISYPNRAASPSEIASIISKSLEESRGPAERSGSDLSRNSRKQQHILDDKRPSKNLESSSSNINNTDKEKEKDQPIPFSSWKTRFRLPRFSVIEAVKHEVLQFPSHQRGDKKFLKQLQKFRESLMDIEDTIINDSRCLFQDFEQPLQTVSKDDHEAQAQSTFNSTQTTPTSNQTNHKSFLKKSRSASLESEMMHPGLISTPPQKIFKSPPIRQWIPVACQALNLNLRSDPTEAEYLKPKKSIKTKISVIYDIGKTPSSNVKYIMKTYYNVGYFVNEMTFFQFAHHPQIPKPLCIEYGLYPSIIMEHVPGETINEAFYKLGISYGEELNSTNYNKLIEEFTQIMGHVFAKLYVTLKYIHSLGFIHSDFKPGNILYDRESGKITVLDFDVCVSAPYVYSGRGSDTIIAPELLGLLEGPVHFGIDWWAYGCTAAIAMSRGLAGFLSGRISEKDEIALGNYLPFERLRDKKKATYAMTPIPNHFPPLMRSFLYPFFSPDPAKRSFVGAKADIFIKSHLFFPSTINWFEYENSHESVYSSVPPYLIGFLKYSRNPQLIKSVNSINQFMYNIINFIGFGKGGAADDDDGDDDGKKDKSESGSVSDDDDEEDEDDDSLSSEAESEELSDKETGYEADSGGFSEDANENDCEDKN